MPSAAITFGILALLMIALACAFVLPALLAGPAPTDALPGPVTASVGWDPPAAEAGRATDLVAMSSTGNPPARAGHGRALPGGIKVSGRTRAHAVARLPLALAFALPAAALGLYAFVGDPDALRGREGPAGFASAGPVAPATLRDDLVRHLARNPRDGRGWVLLARLDFAADRFAEAGQAYERAIAASAKVAGDPAVWCELADVLGMAQGGALAGRPRELVQRALVLDPVHPKALEMAGSAAFEAQEYAVAAARWRELLGLLPERSREHEELAEAIARADALGRPHGLPAPGPGANR
jgi:cytochrome c-type biogenesis protein CcmH